MHYCGTKFVKFVTLIKRTVVEYIKRIVHSTGMVDFVVIPGWIKPGAYLRGGGALGHR